MWVYILTYMTPQWLKCFWNIVSYWTALPWRPIVVFAISCCIESHCGGALLSCLKYRVILNRVLTAPYCSVWNIVLYWTALRRRLIVYAWISRKNMEITKWIWSQIHRTFMSCSRSTNTNVLINTLRPRQNGHNFADDIFKFLFLNENFRVWNKISLKYVPWGLIDNMTALV